MNIKINNKRIAGDFFTPVSIFYKIRDNYPEALLLESSDYGSKEGSYSFLCFDPLQSISIDQGNTVSKVKGNVVDLSPCTDAVQSINDFIVGFEIQDNTPHNGVFGYTSYEAIKYFEKGTYEGDSLRVEIPEIHYALYRFVLVFDHFYDEVEIIENQPIDEASQMQDILNMVQRLDLQEFEFRLDGEGSSNMTDDYFKEMVTTAKEHCQQGEFFQVVPSRRFDFPYKGDDFKVYRKLRSINPSPYLFYFDYGSYRIFGSSPEAQIRIEEGEAEIHPIAGTVKRTGDMIEDQQLTEQLLADPKENSEHIMLVDLARNDMSKNTGNVKVHKFREVQYFSHVIHLVSVVKGQMKEDSKAYQVFADTFPAGTLSGAPKIKALEIIEKLEPTHRSFYGGGIGKIGFDNSLNHAIMIRSFLSKDGVLYMQAGAGIVIDSQEDKELEEVNNKLAALVKALEKAEQ